MGHWHMSPGGASKQMASCHLASPFCLGDFVERKVQDTKMRDTFQAGHLVNAAVMQVSCDGLGKVGLPCSSLLPPVNAWNRVWGQDGSR